MQALQDNAFQCLYELGFSLRKAKGYAHSFDGNLECQGGLVPITLTISDWDFLTYPIIALKERPAFLPKFVPHVLSNGTLCYFGNGSVVLDRYDPATSILQCLSQATSVIDKIVSDPAYRERDLQIEFEHYWSVGNDHISLKGTIEPEAKKTRFFTCRAQSKTLSLITDHDKEVETFSNVLLGAKFTERRFPCWILRTSKPPEIPDSSLPSTVKELINWLKEWDERLYRRFLSIFESDKEFLEYEKICFAIECPTGWLGFHFPIDPIKAKAYKRRPARYRQALHGSEGKTSIERVFLFDAGQDFIHSRNLEHSDLRDKKIAIIGCGAIGGYLAQSLIRLGAGTGKHGILELLDGESIFPGNLGRHYLGYPALLQNKATALKAELNRQFPLSRIEATATNTDVDDRLLTVDLIIDATGEEAFNEKLNASHVNRLPNSPPVLYVRIRGNGECVQTLLVDSLDFGCLRCLLHPPGQSNMYRTELHPTLKHSTARKYMGCQAFTPYAVSASMSAAALATDVVIEWINGQKSPRFRTRYSENADVTRRVKSKNIGRTKSCPACGNV